MAISLNKPEIKPLPKKEYITVEAGLFEHILICLANQKYMPMLHNQSLREHDLQQVIDKAWNEGMEILTKSDKNKNIRIIKQ